MSLCPTNLRGLSLILLHFFMFTISKVPNRSVLDVSMLAFSVYEMSKVPFCWWTSRCFKRSKVRVVLASAQMTALTAPSQKCVQASIALPMANSYRLDMFTVCFMRKGR